MHSTFYALMGAAYALANATDETLDEVRQVLTSVIEDEANEDKFSLDCAGWALFHLEVEQNARIETDHASMSAAFGRAN